MDEFIGVSKDGKSAIVLRDGKKVKVPLTEASRPDVPAHIKSNVIDRRNK